MTAGPRWLAVGLLIGLFGGLAVGCDSAPGDEPCDEERVAGLAVTVTEGAEDGEGVPMCDAVVTAQDGVYWEVLVPVAATSEVPCGYRGAFERPGQYRLEATKENFSTASEAGVTVTQGVCHVIPQNPSLVLTASSSASTR